MDIATSIILIVLTVFGCYSIVRGIFLDIRTEKLEREWQKDITARMQGLSFILLAEQLGGIREINSDDPNWDDVIDSANSLELIAVAYYEGWVGKERLLEIYGEQFSTIFNQILYAKNGAFSGKAILKRVPLVVRLHNDISKSKGIKNEIVV